MVDAKYHCHPLKARALRRAYRLMRAHFGHQGWWPASTAFEMCVGAILTQNTSWRNVELALGSINAAELLEPRKLLALPEHKLARLLRSTGYFNVKAKRLRSFLQVLVNQFSDDLESLFAGTTEEVRERLLSINGIGPETADSMLLYAGGHHRFVIDAYTKRVFERHSWCHAQANYVQLQQLCETALNEKPLRERLDYWQDFHAQLVMVGKHFCRTKPVCESCPLKPLLPRRIRNPRESDPGE